LKGKSVIPSLPFVGREEEIGFLREVLQRTLNDEGKCIIIEGEIGIGKTRLLKEFRDTIDPSPFQVFSGKGMEGGRFMEPFSSMLSHYFSKIENPSQRITRYIPPHDLSILSHLTPQLLRYYPFEVSKSGEASLEMLFSSLFNFFSNLSNLHPLVIVIDDIHWLGEEALEFLEYLCVRIEEMPVLVILSTRGLKGEELLPKVSASRLLRRVQLNPLSQGAIRTALRRLFEQEIPEKFLRWLCRVTKGNPFFIEEIIRTLIKRNLIVYKEGGWEIREYYEDFPLPDNIVSFIRERIKGLSRQGLKFLKAASLLGEEFSTRGMRRLLKNLSKKEFFSCLHLLELEGILEGKGRDTYKFSHPLIREVLVQDMGEKEKRTLHRKIARIIDPERIEEVAFHKTRYLSPEEYTTELLSLLKKTSSLFQNRQDWKKAKEYLKLAQTISSHIPEISEKERLEIESELISIMGQSGEELPPIDRAKEFIEKLLSLGLKGEALNISNVYMRYLMDRLLFKEAEEMLNRTLEVLDPKELVEQWRLRYQRCVLAVKQGRYREAEKEGLKLIKDIDPKISPIGPWFPTNLLGGVTFSYGDLETSKNYYESALKIAEKVGNRDILATSYGNLGLVLREMGEIDRAIDYSKRYLEIVAELGNEYKLAGAYNFLASCALLKRDFLLAESYAQRFKTLAQRNNIKEYILEAGLKWFHIYLEEKRMEDAEKELKNLSSFRLESLSGLHQVEILMSQAIIEMEKGNLQDALNLLDSALSICKEKNLALSEGKVLTQRALCFLKKGERLKAREDFERAKGVFVKRKALLPLAQLLVSFGREEKGRERDSILFQGLEYLKRMGLSERLREVAEKLNRREFPKSYKLIQEYLRREIKGKGEEPLKIFTFGGLFVENPEMKEPIPERLWGSKKAKELLGLLLVLSKRKGVTREVLSSYLWPEMGPKEAQNNFHVTLSHLRKVLGSEKVICEEPFYRLDMEKLWVDYLELERFYKEYSLYKSQGKLHLAEERARKAIKLYQGDFLPEMYSLPIDDEQMILKEKVKEMLLWLAELSKERLEWKEMLTHSHRLLQIDPIDERGHRLVMEALYKSGDRGGAITHYARLKKLLKTELDIDPDPQTEKLYQKLIK